jgi:hypothetical protein
MGKEYPLSPLLLLSPSRQGKEIKDRTSREEKKKTY